MTSPSTSITSTSSAGSAVAGDDMVDALENLDLDPSSASSASLLLRDREDSGQNSTTAIGTDTTRVVELPCGHEIRMTREEMEEMERRELERGDMMDEDEGFRCEECDELEAWKSLDGELDSLEVQVINTCVLRRILPVAAGSFGPWEDILPMMMQQQFAEMCTTALHAMQQGLHAKDVLIGALPADLSAWMEDLSLRALPPPPHPPPPGWWRQLLQAWIRRSINFLIRRRCCDALSRSPGHAGVHWHLDDRRIWWTDPMQMEPIELYYDPE